MPTFISKIAKYQQLILFFAIGVILWAAIGLQLIDHDTPCPRCWESRGVYLLILELLLFSVMLGYREWASLILIALFMVLGNVITVQQLITHTIHLTGDASFKAGYGAYASFLGVSLVLWNLIIANLAILYLCSINYFSHQFKIMQYHCTTPPSQIIAFVWGLAPLLMNVYLFTQHLLDSTRFQ